jgi:hypothetical protein
MERKAILKVIPRETIRDLVDMPKVRHYLIEYPNLLLMFEILINHIEDYIQLRELSTNDTYKSAHI